MKKPEKNVSVTINLRQKAKKIVENIQSKIESPLSETESLRIVHELQVHQIELELMIEELNRAKEEAEVASQKYAELYDFAPSGYFTLTQEGVMVDLNLNGAKMLGKQRSELINSTFAFFVSDDTKSFFYCFLQKIFNKKTNQTCEVVLLSQNKQSINVFIKGVISKNPKHCILNAFNITKRIQAEEALRVSEENNRNIILQTAMDGFWLVDRNGKLLEVNETYCQMSGYSKQELLSMNISDLEALETDEDITNHIKKVIAKGEDRFDTRHRRKDGSLFDVEINIQYQKNDNGRFVAFLHDITRRKRNEEKLLESEQRYRSIFENNNDAIILVDLDSGHYIDCNRMAEQLTGFTRSEIIKMKIGAFLSPAHKAELGTNIEKILEDKCIRLETEIVSKSGKLIPVEFNSSLITINKRRCILSMLHDISDRKTAEDALKLSEERVRFKLQSILSPEGSIADLELNDIIDTQAIQKLMDHFYVLAHFPMAILDVYGNILVGVGWQDICSKFHRAYPNSCQNCIESDIELTKGIPEGEFKLYKCKNNMWEMATPLVIGGEHKGNLYLGQFFLDDEPIDYNLFLNQADKYNFAKQDYLDALEQVPRLNKHKLDHAKSFFLILAQSISRLSYSNIKLSRSIHQQKKFENKLRENERLFSESQAAAKIGSYSTDLVQKTWKGTQAIYEIFGIDKSFPHTLDGWVKCIHPDFREVLVNDLFTEDKKSDIFEHEYKIIRINDGEERWVHGHGKFEYNNKRHPVKLIGTIQDITNRKRAEESLKHLNEELENRVKERTEELLNVTVQVEERERNRFSHELHDNLGPLLSAVKLYFQWLAETENPDKRKIIIEKGNSSIEMAIQTAREISHGLGSQILNNLGFVGAIQNFTQSVNDTQKIHIDFKFNSNNRFGNFLEITLYRITMELINNTLKYAGATQIEIVFNYDMAENMILFTYFDNGIGFDLTDVEKNNKGLGLMNIQNRIRLINGSIVIESEHGKGIKVQIEIPVIEGIFSKETEESSQVNKIEI